MSEELSVLPADSSALVVDGDGEMTLWLNYKDPDATVPQMVLLLAAVMKLSDDPDWVKETLKVLDQPPRETVQ